MSDDFFTDDFPTVNNQEFIEEDPFADASTSQSVSHEDPFGSTPSSSVEDEFRFTREWNMQFRERCETKDKAAMEEKQKILQKARDNLQSWREERGKKLSAKAKMNREEEAKLVEGSKDDISSANPWERVSKLIDVSVSSDKNMGRMKQVMIRMKNDTGKM